MDKIEKTGQELEAKQSEELNDADLEQVAGGKGNSEGNSMGDVDCHDNPGAFNSVVTMNSEVSLV